MSKLLLLYIIYHENVVRGRLAVRKAMFISPTNSFEVINHSVSSLNVSYIFAVLCLTLYVILVTVNIKVMKMNVNETHKLNKYVYAI